MNVHFAAPMAQTKTRARGAVRKRAARFVSERLELEGPLAMLELRWEALLPTIERSLGGAAGAGGSGDHILAGRQDARDYHVLTKLEADVLELHLRELGELIDQISDINRRA
ncbi:MULTISPECIES: hypothetical protein [Hyphomicrobiales]|jgi:hypothetical protein|uniref:hypothetical protein n=1 Tax=Methylobacterium sp. CCH7-A2 TaxID=1768789 RepID=UPI0008335704|nr:MULTISPECIES: hypothetical protein [Hyphomicrobiales]